MAEVSSVKVTNVKVASFKSVAVLVKTLLYYIQLTKPTIMLLVVLSSAASLSVANAFPNEGWKYLLALFAVYLTGGCANALNQYFERDVDAKMERTKYRRPIPSGHVSPASALVFSLTIGVTGVFIFAYFFNWLSAVLSFFTIIFYSFFYTLWLKPNTPQNIVIGGISGAMSPIGVWLAARGTVDWEPFLIFLIIFFWTPPHFWALALYCKSDYEKVDYPMLPNVKGIDETFKQMLIYTGLTIMTTIWLAFVFQGAFYTIAVIGLGVMFFRKVLNLIKSKGDLEARAVFGIVFGFWYYGSPMNTDVGYRPKQPVPYSHKLHAGTLGLDCRYCHTSVEVSANASIPSVETCMGCHTNILKESPKLLPVRESWATGMPVEWVRIHKLGDYAYFNHSVHVNSGVGCGSCHGNVAKMEVVSQVEPLSMGWCLDCHRNPDMHLRPASEITNMDWVAPPNQIQLASMIKKERSLNPPTTCASCHR
ncbi:hypothetical protein CHS0354_023978 [Potamilus streckersoni]|uniref:Protoheme IX farnesyltransferase n=1 Tax=Potamilus streckersoni TaxID=2493646 RepID=A0AAE0RZB7_9BIVA|nr:hypothetical protein CHS0354_023978 [Potamilus streckersoni]